MSKVIIPHSLRVKLKGMVSRGIAALEVNEQGHLIITLTDGTVEDLGKVSGDDGKDGTSVAHKWDGTVLIVTSASGTSEADLKGEAGYTPQKGVDYFDGKDGAPFTYEDFTEEQLDALKGEKGDAFTYEDFTEEQLDDLKGDKGDTGVYVGNEEPQDDSVLIWFDEDNDDALDKRVQEAIDAALTAAKESGEFDGKDGQDGKDGVSAEHSWNGTVLTIKSASGESSADLKGEKGDAGFYPVVTLNTTTAEIQPNIYYRFGEVTTLNITLAAAADDAFTNEYIFEFISGATATTLTLPDSIKWVAEPIIVANKAYQVSIMNGIGVIGGA